MKDLIVIFPFGNDRSDVELFRHVLLFREHHETIVVTSFFFEGIIQKHFFNRNELEKDSGIKIINHAAGKILTTCAIADYATKFAITNGCNRITAVAAPQHIRRCVRNLEKCNATGNATELIVIGSCPKLSSAFFYTKSSAKFSVRNSFCWWTAEVAKRLLARLLPFRAYFILAS